MDYYKPYQSLSYFYNTREGNIYLKSSVSVYMRSRESLATQDVLNDGISAVILKFNDIQDVAKSVDYLYVHDTMLRVIEKAKVSYNAADLAGSKNSVLACVTEDLKNKGVSFYSVTAYVYKLDGSVGGQVTNTISQQGEVIIL